MCICVGLCGGAASSNFGSKSESVDACEVLNVAFCLVNIRAGETGRLVYFPFHVYMTNVQGED